MFERCLRRKPKISRKDVEERSDDLSRLLAKLLHTRVSFEARVVFVYQCHFRVWRVSVLEFGDFCCATRYAAIFSPCASSPHLFELQFVPTRTPVRTYSNWSPNRSELKLCPSFVIRCPLSAIRCPLSVVSSPPSLKERTLSPRQRTLSPTGERWRSRREAGRGGGAGERLGERWRSQREAMRAVKVPRLL